MIGSECRICFFLVLFLFRSAFLSTNRGGFEGLGGCKFRFVANSKFVEENLEIKMCQKFSSPFFIVCFHFFHLE